MGTKPNGNGFLRPFFLFLATLGLFGCADLVAPAAYEADVTIISVSAQRSEMFVPLTALANVQWYAIAAVNTVNAA